MRALLLAFFTFILLNSCESFSGKPTNKGTFGGEISYVEYIYLGGSINPKYTRGFKDTIEYTMWEDKEGLYLELFDKKHYFGADNNITINNSLSNGTEKIQIIRKTGSFDYSRKVNTANDTAEIAVLGSGILVKK